MIASRNYCKINRTFLLVVLSSIFSGAGVKAFLKCRILSAQIPKNLAMLSNTSIVTSFCTLSIGD